MVLIELDFHAKNTKMSFITSKSINPFLLTINIKRVILKLKGSLHTQTHTHTHNKYTQVAF